MTIGDGLACIAMAVAGLGMVWAGVWYSIRSKAIQSEALRYVGEPTWQTKTTTRRRPA